MPIAVIILALAAALLTGASAVQADILNTGLMISQANQDAALALTDVPRNMTDPSTSVTIRWSPADVGGRLRYAQGYAGESPDGYASFVSPVDSGGGFVTIVGNQLPVGYLYCIIDGGEAGHSVVFNIIRVTENAPRMVAPITGAGREGINTVTPTFRWDPISGVPFYHVVVSDQPFRITRNEQTGETRVEGANVIWQAITAQTSIQFGIPDPAEFFDNDQVAPLVGSMDRRDRPRYAWVVLNNFSNHPAYSSTITGGVSGFEVEMRPPFDEPQNIRPAGRTSLNSREILFRWTQVDEAVSYFVYVNREEVTAGGSRALVPAWNAQTTLTSIACPAVEVLPDGRYIWKVLAADRQGRGTISDTISFHYVIRSGTVAFETVTSRGDPLEFVQIEVESIEGPGVPTLSTNDEGTQTRVIPVGIYRFTASKEGYADTTTVPLTVEADGNYSVTLRLRPILSSIIGMTADEQRRAVNGATITASRVPGGDITTAESNISGEYQLIVTPGNYLLNATARGRRAAEEVAVSVPTGENVEAPLLQLPAYRYTITGYVRNSSGQPISSATVIMIGPDGGESRSFTPEAGSYSFNVGAGRWRLSALKSGFYLESGEVEANVVDRNLEINFTLVPQAGILSGQVIVDGSPANRNAEVWYIPSAGAVITTTVNQVGGFSRGVAPGDWTVVAVRPGYHTADSLAVAVGPGETISGLRLVLEGNPSSIAGRITDAGGNPLGDTYVEAGGVTALADANGNYIMRVAAASHTIVASKSGYVTARRGPISLEAGQNLGGLDLRLVDNAGTISGRVRRGNDPLFDALVVATPSAGGLRQTTRTDPAGRYAFGLAYGDYRLTVERDGFTAAHPGYIDVPLLASQVVSGRDFAMLNYSSRIVGNVATPAGVVNTPTIRITQLDDPNRFYTTNGNVQGEFALSVAPQRRYIVTASKVGFSAAADTTGLLAAEADTVIDLRLTPLPCAISGVVTAGASRLAGATVRVAGDAGVFGATTDRAGRYQVSLPPGPYRVTASKPGYAAAESQISLNPGDQREGVNFDLQREFALITGLTLESGGAGVAGVEITVIDSANQRSRVAVSDQDGAYRVEGVVPGTYDLIAVSRRHRRAAMDMGAVLGGQQRRGINIVLQPLTARITGRVAASGAGVANATVYAVEEGGERFTAISGADGSYSVDAISEGLFSLRAARTGWTGVVLTGVVLRAAETLTRDLDMVANNARIDGVVRDGFGVGLRGVRVSAVDSLGNFAAATTNSAGQFNLDNLYPNTNYNLSARLIGYAAAPDTLRGVAPGSGRDLLMSPHRSRLIGKVVNQVRQGLGGTELVATSLADGSIYRTTADGDGNFAFDGLAANTDYRLQTQRFEDIYVNADTTISDTTIALGTAYVRIIQRSAGIRGLVGLPDVTIETRNDSTGRRRIAYSGADGSYRIFGMRGGDFGSYVVRAGKAGLRVRESDGVKVDTLDITEERPGIDFHFDTLLVSISGRVTDSGGAAKAGCRVMAWSESGQWEDTTDAAGGFSFSRLFPDETYSLATDLPRDGYDNGTAQIVIGAVSQTGVVLTIGRHNATITGWVQRSDGQPLENVAVSLDAVRTSQTDAAGVYRFDFVAPAGHRLTFSRAGYVTHSAMVSAGNGEGEYPGDATMVALDRAIYGTVVLTNTGTPLAGCRVLLTSDTGDSLYDTTDFRGTFQFNSLDAARRNSLLVTKRGFSWRNRDNISVAGGNSEQDFNLYPLKPSVYGRLLNAQGAPVVGGRVTLRSFANKVVTNIADYFGDYSLPAEAGTYILLGAAPSPSTISTISQSIVLAPDSALLVNLTLEASGRVLGRLALEDGNAPRTTARVTASHNASGETVFNWSLPDGGFELAGLRPGGWTLVVNASGYAMQVGSLPFDARADETLALTVRMTASGRAIGGYVKDAEGRGVARSRVAVRGNTPGDLVTDGDGYWSLAGPRAGSYTISVVRNGYHSLGERTFDLGAGEIRLFDTTAIRVPQAISGRILSQSGLPSAGVPAVLSRDNNPLDSLITDAFGEFIFDTLDVGEYLVTPHIDGYAVKPSRASAQITTGGSRLDLDFALTAARGEGAVQGTLTHSGSPVLRANVRIVNSETGERFEPATNDSGRFVFRNVPTPGNFRLVASVAGAPEVRGELFLLQSGEDLEKNLAFPNGQIKVLLLNADGGPVVGRRVWVSGMGVNFTALYYSGAAGRLETLDTLDWLPAGRYSVAPEALAQMLPPAPKEVTLGVGERRELTWFLGWRLIPPPPFNYEAGARCSLRVPAAVVVDSAKIYWRGPGDANFRSDSLRHQASGSSRQVLRNVTPPSPPLLSRGGEGGVSGAAAVVYYGDIPPQRRSGTLTFYLEVRTADGFLFGGPATAQDVVVTARGMLDYVVLDRSQAALPPRVGVPIRLSLGGFDDGNNDLTETLRRDGHFAWREVGESRGLLVVDPANSAVARYTPSAVGPVEIGATVTQPQTGVTVNESAQWFNVEPAIARMRVTAPLLAVVAGDSIRFTINATDTGGALIPVAPVWSVTPAGVAVVQPVLYNMDAWLTSRSGVIGRVQVTATDTLSGMADSYNDDSPDRSQRGLAIYGELRSDGISTAVFSDGASFEIRIPPTALDSGAVARVFLSEPTLSPVFRLTPKYELPPIGYKIQVEGDLSQTGEYQLTFPIQAGFRALSPTVGVWNAIRIGWDVVEGQFNADGTAVVMTTDRLDGLYALISASEPLGVRDLKFNPNPFSPFHPFRPGVSIEFRLTSNLGETPVLSVKIYNMAGQLVRKLVESLQKPKGSYFRGGENELIWDGITDDGLPARNGRYIVVVIAKDASGESKVVGSAVLVK